MKSHAPTSAERAEACPFCGGAAQIIYYDGWHNLSVAHVDDCVLSGDGPEMTYMDAPGVVERMLAKWNRRAAMQTAEPVAWVRRHPDGALTAEFLEDAVIEPVRRNSGAWLPLVLGNRTSAKIARVAPDRAPSIAPACHCEACEPHTPWNSRMILCATCGNKRCPHATNHRNACTGSNEPGQVGSSYGPAPSIDSAADAKWQRLLKAAEAYTTNYCQDEAEPESDHDDMVCCVDQHEKAVELFAAIAALQPEGEQHG